jgi:hypothetical protein
MRNISFYDLSIDFLSSILVLLIVSLIVWALWNFITPLTWHLEYWRVCAGVLLSKIVCKTIFKK